MNANIKNLLWTTLAVVIGLQLNTQVTKMMNKKPAASAGDEE
tara:strand:+ start:2034 stop:2159 length:126 start_codon:yes stop_codon:yes gene_type:complete